MTANYIPSHQKLDNAVFDRFCNIYFGKKPLDLSAEEKIEVLNFSFEEVKEWLEFGDTVDVHRYVFYSLFPTAKVAYNNLVNRMGSRECVGRDVPECKLGGKSYKTMRVFSLNEITRVTSAVINSLKTLNNGSLYIDQWIELRKSCLKLYKNK